MKRLAGFALAAFLIGPITTSAQTAAPSSAPVSSFNWLGVTLGEPAQEVLDKFGDAGFSQTPDGILYSYGLGKGAFSFKFRNGHVSSIAKSRDALFGEYAPGADPFGVVLDDVPDKIKQERGAPSDTKTHGVFMEMYYAVGQGVQSVYSFNQTKMWTQEIDASDAAIDALPKAAAPVFHGGTSFSDAVVVIAPDKAIGSSNESNYLLSKKCSDDRGGFWVPGKRDKQTQNGHSYEIVHLTCRQNTNTRDLYFDVTGVSGA